MRLIDADALDAEMYHKSFEVDDGRNVWNSGLWIRYKIFEEALRDAPTVDAVPVVHGRWIKDRLVSTNGGTYGVRRCSVCEWCFEDLPYEFKYCPRCGARMDEVKEKMKSWYRKSNDIKTKDGTVVRIWTTVFATDDYSLSEESVEWCREQMTERREDDQSGDNGADSAVLQYLNRHNQICDQ